MVEWNGIFRLFRFSGILGQPREVHPKFRNEIPENVCSICSQTRNFRNFWSNGKRPLTLMKLKQNYKNLHLAQLFSYSVATVTYIVLTSFNVIIGVAPNPVITYVSDRYPGSVFDKCIVHFVPGDMILADQRFLIQDLLTKGVSVNMPPFLNCGKFTE